MVASASFIATALLALLAWRFVFRELLAAKDRALNASNDSHALVVAEKDAKIEHLETLLKHRAIEVRRHPAGGGGYS